MVHMIGAQRPPVSPQKNYENRVRILWERRVILGRIRETIRTLEPNAIYWWTDYDRYTSAHPMATVKITPKQYHVARMDPDGRAFGGVQVIRRQDIESRGFVRPRRGYDCAFGWYLLPLLQADERRWSEIVSRSEKELRKAMAALAHTHPPPADDAAAG